MREASVQRPPGRWLFEQPHVILDTRSPKEFDKGHITGALSFPLFDNDERAVIGTLYKQIGKDAAVEQGLEYVGPKMAEFVREAKERFAAQAKPLPLVVHCWRGGMRSGAVAWLLEMAGLNTIKITGGYKAYRSWARKDFAQIANLRILGGMTGVGKTQILKEMRAQGAQVVDLEGRAGHLGSAFGNLKRLPQPTSEQFSNDCHFDLVTLDADKPIWMENESRTIGTVNQPQELFDALREAPVWAVRRTKEERIDELCRVYGDANREELKQAFVRIREKLGGLKMREALDALDREDLRSAAAIGLMYYDKLYRHTRDRYPRDCYSQIECSGMSFADAAAAVLAKAKD